MTIGTAFQALRSNVTQLAQWTEDALTDLASQISTGWNVEHDGDGHHTAITATSLASTGPVQASLFTINPSFIVTIDAGAVAGVTIAPSIRAAHIRLTLNSGPIRIDGLDGTLYQLGDIVILSNASDDGGAVGSLLTVRLQSTTVTNIDNRFRGDPGTPNTDITVTTGRMLILIRDKDSAGPRMYWRVSRF